MEQALENVSDAQLREALGNAAADLALAEKYEHNQPVAPQIRKEYDRLWAEVIRRDQLRLEEL